MNKRKLHRTEKWWKERAERAEMAFGHFVREGTMVAFPLCFPEVSVQLPADESHVTALDVTPDGVVYGGTSGRRAHVFMATFHGNSAAVIETTLIDGADNCAAVCCGKKTYVACVNGPDGGRILAQRLWMSYRDTIQEWVLMPWPAQDLGLVAPGERIVHAVADPSRRFVIGLTERHLFQIDMDTLAVTVLAEMSGSGRLTPGRRNSVFGIDEGRTLWRYDARDGTLTRRAVALPDGDWTAGPIRWARDPNTGLLYAADAEGRLFSFDETAGFSALGGRTPHAPAGPMAVTFDGRLFGFSGEGIATLFCYDPRTGDVADLGSAVSAIQRRRYGYVFGDAVTGRDGQIIFGEDDELGHIWLYFPRIARP